MLTHKNIPDGGTSLHVSGASPLRSFYWSVMAQTLSKLERHACAVSGALRGKMDAAKFKRRRNEETSMAKLRVLNQGHVEAPILKECIPLLLGGSTL